MASLIETLNEIKGAKLRRIDEIKATIADLEAEHKAIIAEIRAAGIAINNDGSTPQPRGRRKSEEFAPEPEVPAAA